MTLGASRSIWEAARAVPAGGTLLCGEPQPPARRLSSAPGAAAAPAITPASPRLLPCGRRGRPLVPRRDRGDAGGHGRGTCWLKGTATKLASPLLACSVRLMGYPRSAPRGGEGIPATPSPHGPAAALGWRQEGESPVPRADPGTRPRPAASLLLRSAWFGAGYGNARCCLLSACRSGLGFYASSREHHKGIPLCRGGGLLEQCLPQPPLASLGHFSCVNTSLHAPLQRRATLSRLRVIMNIPPAISTGCWKSLFSR